MCNSVLYFISDCLTSSGMPVGQSLQTHTVQPNIVQTQGTIPEFPKDIPYVMLTLGGKEANQRVLKLSDREQTVGCC